MKSILFHRRSQDQARRTRLQAGFVDRFCPGDGSEEFKGIKHILYSETRKKIARRRERFLGSISDWHEFLSMDNCNWHQLLSKSVALGGPRREERGVGAAREGELVETNEDSEEISDTSPQLVRSWSGTQRKLVNKLANLSWPSWPFKLSRQT